MEYNTTLEENLIDRCLQGDKNAHFKIYGRYAKAMYNICCRIVGDEDEAADVLQDAFISAFENLKSYRKESTFGAWLKRIVVNKALNSLKRKRWEPMDEAFDLSDEVVELEDYGLTLELVKNAIAQLPEGYRMVVLLYLVEGYDHQEIGDILGVSESTSKSQLNRAKKRLREILTVKG